MQRVIKGRFFGNWGSKPFVFPKHRLLWPEDLRSAAELMEKKPWLSSITVGDAELGCGMEFFRQGSSATQAPPCFSTFEGKEIRNEMREFEQMVLSHPWYGGRDYFGIFTWQRAPPSTFVQISRSPERFLWHRLGKPVWELHENDRLRQDVRFE